VRVVLDTNVLLSGLISPAGPPSLLIDAWLDRRFVLVSHELQLDELREVSRRDKIRALVRASAAGRLVNQIRLLADMPDALPPLSLSPDPRDDFLLALCDAGAVDRLVTGDKAGLLALGRHGRADIVTAARLAEELGL
jgi:putative PIN family toxin of toxin-antitoxin system